jgi:hypothetical protein
LADGPPLILDFADPAEPDTLRRKLHARAFLVGIFNQAIDIYTIFLKLDSGRKTWAGFEMAKI